MEKKGKKRGQGSIEISFPPNRALSFPPLFLPGTISITARTVGSNELGVRAGRRVDLGNPFERRAVGQKEALVTLGQPF